MDDLKLFCVQDAWAAMLTRENIEELQRLCVSCIDYYQLHGEIDVPMNAAEELFDDLPQGKTNEDKMIIGLFKREGEIIGIIEALRGYPDKDCWFIGQMMLNPAYRENGMGRNFYLGYERWVCNQGISKIRLGVLQENKRAYRFWQELGFEKIYTKENYKIKEKETTVYVMEKNSCGKF